ncbi:MAG: hypothetical protein CVU47_12995 [Chloroflexi bacterium HGW-Chloroflexi-9]|nr:MAG: hypothetical protein CVU47_12995 [Chloroflexi bacterium HGW-Chloroflexi-9]
MTSITLPRWIPAAAALAFIAWAVTIWWMIATLPASGSESAPVEMSAVVTEIDRLNGEIATLAQHVADLQAAGVPLDGAAPGTAPAAALALPDDVVEATTAATDDADTPDVAAEADAVSLFFTNGADRYNCRDFSSYADAQEALRVNRPGDPNRIDMNNNNQACEDFAYPDRPRGTAPGATVPTATPKP